jgi:hypothetical protein
VLGVTTKCSNVTLNPLESCTLVKEAGICHAVGHELGRGKEAEEAELLSAEVNIKVRTRY